VRTVSQFAREIRHLVTINEELSQTRHVLDRCVDISNLWGGMTTHDNDKRERLREKERKEKTQTVI